MGIIRKSFENTSTFFVHDLTIRCMVVGVLKKSSQPQFKVSFAMLQFSPVAVGNISFLLWGISKMLGRL